MADKTGLLPPLDLLQGLEGIEAGLKKNHKAGLAGWLALLPSLAGLYTTLQSTADASGGVRPVYRILIGACAGAVAISLYLIGRSRLWRRESREPFRYTCSVRPFQALGQLAKDEFSELSEWMVYDMSERLNERIGRLSFLDSGAPTEPTASKGTPPADINVGSHIDVTGQYLVRARDRQRVIELTPRVRIGGNRSAATLGHPVKFTITESSRQAAGAIETSGSHTDRIGTAPGRMETDEYDKLIERVYFSVATQIYRQIREDVGGKIRLLPTRFLKATAYFYEAEDYARSNTLDAYDEARKLFREAMQLYDPRLRPLPARKIYRLGLWLSQVKTSVTWPVRRHLLANFFPRMGMLEVMAARSETGYANTLLYRRLLAGMQGHRLNPMYEARPIVVRAIKRLRHIPADVPGQQEALFQAYVAGALSWWSLDSIREAQKCLREARRVVPSAFDTDARYLYAAGLIEPRLHSSVPALRQAVERDPRFEIAQFQLAIRSEMNWRRGHAPERPVAQMVVEEYAALLKLNPGNIRAWGNIGYMRWLMGDLDDARLAFERGREYKQIQRETDIGSLDYGLARTAAEQGNLAEAYAYYLAAIAAQVTQGVSDARATSSQYYFFDYVGDAILGRFQDYCASVVQKCDSVKNDSIPADPARNDAPLDTAVTRANVDVTPRVYDSVAAFALNDLAEAYHTYYIRNGDKEAAQAARQNYAAAISRDRSYVIPHYNLFLMNRYEGDIDAATKCLDEVQDLEPGWPDAILARIALPAEWANDSMWRTPVAVPSGNGRRGSRGRQKLSVEMPEEVRQKARLDEFDEDVKVQLESLVPHHWLWKSGEDLEFNWRAVYKVTFDKSMKWEKELDDLHVRSLFMWDMANLLTNERGPRSARALGQIMRRADWGEDVLASAPQMLLKQIKNHFWPADLRLLLTWRQIYPEDRDAEESVRYLVRHWLGQDATSYWALDLMVTDVYDFHGGEIEFFTADEKERYLRKALSHFQDLSAEAGDSGSRAATSMERWIREQLKILDSGKAALPN
jgi:tetratricopeptide (TPR) repeat protein